QAEDGIRDFHVTGVQTCALPICLALLLLAPHALCLRPAHSDPPAECELECVLECVLLWSITRARGLTPLAPSGTRDPLCEMRCRSEERRVGKGGRSEVST